MDHSPLIKYERQSKNHIFPQDPDNPIIMELIQKHNGERPHGLVGGHPAIGLILWSLVVAGSIPASLYYAYQKDGIKSIPKGFLNGIVSTTCWTIYLPTIVTYVFGQIPVCIVDLATFQKMNLISRMRESMYSTLYRLNDIADDSIHYR
jgi:hypothetical protein